MRVEPVRHELEVAVGRDERDGAVVLKPADSSLSVTNTRALTSQQQLRPCGGRRAAAYRRQGREYTLDSLLFVAVYLYKHSIVYGYTWIDTKSPKNNL